MHSLRPGPALRIALLLLAASAARGQWTDPVVISRNAIAASQNESMGPCLIADSGTLHVVWADHRTRGSAIFYAISQDSGATWSTPLAATDTLGSASWPVVAASGAAVHVAWLDTTLGHTASWYARSTDGGAHWTAPFCLDSDTQFWPGLSASGSLVVAALNPNLAGNTEVLFRRSRDGGTTWDSIVHLSNAPGRSEDPSIVARGNDIVCAWNDNRNGPMEIYGRHSSDGGTTWGDETALTSGAARSYSTMAAASDSGADVTYGDQRSGTFEVYYRHSVDAGAAWGSERQVTSSPTSGVYPYLVRSGANLHLAFLQLSGAGAGPWYTRSTDGGATFSTPQRMGHGAQPFLAVTGTTVHLVWTDSGRVYSRRFIGGNPSGGSSGVTDGETPAISSVALFPNPASDAVMIRSLSASALERFEVWNALGARVQTWVLHHGLTATFSVAPLPAGIYLVRAGAAGGAAWRGRLSVVH